MCLMKYNDRGYKRVHKMIMLWQKNVTNLLLVKLIEIAVVSDYKVVLNFVRSNNKTAKATLLLIRLIVEKSSGYNYSHKLLLLEGDTSPPMLFLINNFLINKRSL